MQATGAGSQATHLLLQEKVAQSSQSACPSADTFVSKGREQGQRASSSKPGRRDGLCGMGKGAGRRPDAACVYVQAVPRAGPHGAHQQQKGHLPSRMPFGTPLIFKFSRSFLRCHMLNFVLPRTKDKHRRAGHTRVGGFLETRVWQEPSSWARMGAWPGGARGTGSETNRDPPRLSKPGVPAA